ncbi:MAG: OmpA family protein [Bacteroidota bacterium]
MTRFATLLVVLAVAAGCSGPPAANPRVEAAQAALQSARDAGAEEDAPVAFAEAREAYERAESSRLAKEDIERTEHLAYLALQRARIATETARLNATSREIEAAREERQRVQLEARTAEAEAAARRAEAARQEAERQRLEAERQRAEAIAAQQEAQQQRAEAEEARRRAEAALARAQELAAQVEDLQAQLTNRGLVLTLGDVLFDTGQSTLKAGGLSAVDRLVAFLNDYPQRSVLIEGFTDSTGSDETNQRLSERRAAAVRQALMERGVADTRIRTIGYGENYPVATNDTPAGRQQNRRVEVVISDDDGTIPARAGG